LREAGRLRHIPSVPSLHGQLLLDGGQLTGSEFDRAVVLVCLHDAEGAFGLVLNRLSPRPVGEVVSVDLPAPLAALPLGLGGPVQPDLLTCLARDHRPAAPDEPVVLPGLRLVHQVDRLPPVEPATAAQRVRFFAGYAGWAPGQLDAELARGAWLTHPATLALVFDPQPDQLWRQILRRKGPRYRLLADSPPDPSRN
jgi:putative transcriptional regulator